MRKSNNEYQRMSSPNNPPFFSIITVCYNALHTLRQTVESVANQTEDDYEHIIIDGGSTDGTVDFLNQLNNSHLRWISEKDSGIYNAMNKGIQLARGKVISFLNADDAYFPTTLESVKKVFDSEVQVVYGDLRKERLLIGQWYHRIEKPNLDLMPQTMGIFHPATFVQRTLFVELGGYDEQYRFSADYDWLLKAYLSGAHFHYLPEPLAIFRVGGVSNMNCESYEEGLRILQHHQTGFENQMQQLVKQCRKKVFSRKAIHFFTNVTGTRRLLEKRMSKNWIKNDGGFGS